VRRNRQVLDSPDPPEEKRASSKDSRYGKDERQRARPGSKKKIQPLRMRTRSPGSVGQQKKTKAGTQKRIQKKHGGKTESKERNVFEEGKGTGVCPRKLPGEKKKVASSGGRGRQTGKNLARKQARCKEVNHKKKNKLHGPKRRTTKRRKESEELKSYSPRGRPKT